MKVISVYPSKNPRSDLNSYKTHNSQRQRAKVYLKNQKKEKECKLRAESSRTCSVIVKITFLYTELKLMENRYGTRSIKLTSMDL